MLAKTVFENWRGLIKPKGVEVERSSLTKTYGKFVIKPLERGYGITIGNSLRRILLSSLRGAAITSVKIEGILHEYTSIPDIAEDVTDVVLNLKEVRFHFHSEEPKIIRISKKGPGVVTAADFELDSTVEVLNPDQHICTISKGGSFNVECVVEWGRGYVVAEDIDKNDKAVGSIALDALFSPVTKVNYSVTNARVGQKTDYDKLTLEVWTDGSVGPDAAVAFGSKILKDQLSVFINFEEEEEPQEHQDGEQKVNQNLFKSVNELELSVRSANCLKNANIKTIYELVTKSEPDMLRTKNFGRKSLNEIKEILKTMGLHLGMKLDHIQPPSEELSQGEEEVLDEGFSDNEDNEGTAH
ncbi:MAG: DNA-directed RNA polymerase subunit alpha [Deltaproteobacteria bacterium]|nr:DNA-directed RNA polymerase subunit alpha [Deltaproteobacteria bacterium]